MGFPLTVGWRGAELNKDRAERAKVQHQLGENDARVARRWGLDPVRGSGVDIVLDWSGTPSVLQTRIQIQIPGGFWQQHRHQQTLRSHQTVGNTPQLF